MHNNLRFRSRRHLYLMQFAMKGESIKSGLTAGFAASAVLGILMIIKSRLGILPDFDPIRDIVAIADKYTGLQFPPDLGWVGHF